MTYYVYILINKRHTVLYTGVTNSLERRIFQHKTKFNRGFTSKYNCDQLVYFEEYSDVRDAIHREKQLKKYLRKWKIELITNLNPSWKDLSEGWYDDKEFSRHSSRS